MPIGTSFNPAKDDENGNGQNRQRQQAIQVLALRLPKFVGARSIAPAALLSGQNVGGGQMIGAVLRSLLQQAATQPGAFPPPQVAQPSPGSPAPTSGLFQGGRQPFGVNFQFQGTQPRPGVSQTMQQFFSQAQERPPLGNPNALPDFNFAPFFRFSRV